MKIKKDKNEVKETENKIDSNQIDLSKNNDLKNHKSVMNLFDTKDIRDYTKNQILMELLNDDKNIYLKTDIEHVREFTSLKVLERACFNAGLKITSKVIKVYIYYYMRYRISHKRKSRKEIIFALTQFQDLINTNGSMDNIKNKILAKT